MITKIQIMGKLPGVETGTLGWQQSSWYDIYDIKRKPQVLEPQEYNLGTELTVIVYTQSGYIYSASLSNNDNIQFLSFRNVKRYKGDDPFTEFFATRLTQTGTYFLKAGDIELPVAEVKDMPIKDLTKQTVKCPECGTEFEVETAAE